MYILHRYDNDNSKYKPYNLDTIVTAQIECSFQANLMYNFPFKYQKKGIFNNVNLTMLKKEFVKKLSHTGNHKKKKFLLRCGFDQPKDINNRKIVSVEQVAVTSYGFPRSIQRIKKKDNKFGIDFCHCIEFNLRMVPLSKYIKKKKK